MKDNHSIGHLSAIVTIFMWGTTFISTKILLTGFEPTEILIFRFVLGFIALILVYPRPMKGVTKGMELLFIAAGLTGVCLYYLLENIALTFTMASNASVLVSIAPFFTAILSRLVNKNEKLRPSFFLGFVVAISGIVLISANGAKLSLNPIGDVLCILAAISWAIYSVLIKKMSNYGFNTIQITRRIFFYGIIFMLPAIPLYDFSFNLTRFANPVYLFNFLFLGLGASALCFVTWNFSVKILGPVKTSVYIYAVPVITVIASALILHEKITVMAAVGTLLTLAGLFLSESNIFNSKRL